MAIHFLVGLAGRAWVGGGAAGMQKLIGDGFVVHGQQTPLGAVGVTCRTRGVQPKIFHAVVVVTRAAGITGVGAVVQKGGGSRVQRVTQGIDHAGRVAGRHGDLVQQALVDGCETQFEIGSWRGGGTGSGRCGRRAGATAAGAQGQARKNGAASGAHTCTQQATTA